MSEEADWSDDENSDYWTDTVIQWWTVYSIILWNVHVCHDVIDDVMTSPVHVVSIKLCIKIVISIYMV